MDSKFLTDISSELYLVGSVFILSLIMRKLIGAQDSGVLSFISVGVGVVALYNITLQISISTSEPLSSCKIKR